MKIIGCYLRRLLIFIRVEGIGTIDEAHLKLRVVPKGRAFNYNGPFRQFQVIDPFSILKLRDETVKVGAKLKNYLAYRGFDISPKAEASIADAIGKLSGEDIKKAILGLMG